MSHSPFTSNKNSKENATLQYLATLRRPCSPPWPQYPAPAPIDASGYASLRGGRLNTASRRTASLFYRWPQAVSQISYMLRYATLSSQRCNRRTMRREHLYPSPTPRPQYKIRTAQWLIAIYRYLIGCQIPSPPNGRLANAHRKWLIGYEVLSQRCLRTLVANDWMEVLCLLSPLAASRLRHQARMSLKRGIRGDTFSLVIA